MARRSNKDAKLERQLTELGLSFVWFDRLHLDDFDDAKSLQNQARFKALEPAKVTEYAEAMKRGDVLPPIVAHQSGKKLVRLDGNHRATAAREAGMLEYPGVYVVDGRPATLALFSYQANSRHGMATSEDERAEQGIWLINSGQSLATAAAAVNVREYVLSRAWRRREADRRADEVGILRSQWDSLHHANKDKMLSIATDEGFAAAVKLALKARLSNTEIIDLTRRVNESKSAVKQVAVVKNAEQFEYQERIQGGGALTERVKRSGRTPKQTWSVAVGTLLSSSLEDASSLASAFAPQERQAAAQRSREVGEKLLKMADALESLD